ncbi:Metal-dependent hydrolase, composite domain-containing protein [Cynara cardunculus var. scolymus]|uniref:Metal-dependent hydrolase, composite domain-containing protein n=1 Tax=Cynara cardunculus var. scolymus TaxID=59895 RepID=A0A124SB50_CYNCS|nr:Metal-dependent hydrolase, composite domain-containing protein [Cynara cardunculus var. scolymus]
MESGTWRLLISMMPLILYLLFILYSNHTSQKGQMKNGPVIDYGEAVVMPGLIDVHAHLDDPGRTEWEGFPSGTKAAVAGTSIRREEAAIRELLTVSKDTRIGGPAEGAHLHIVHLSDSRSSLELIKEAKGNGDSITVETCPHYLAFSAEEIPEGDTRFKCAPPIRDAPNKEKLWEALMDGHIDMLSSDHSPSVPKLKLFAEGDFLKAWGGISSLQFVLPVTWSYGLKYGVTLERLVSWWSEKPAKLAGQDMKGAIAIGKDADIVVWEPEEEFNLDENHHVHLKHPSISAYMGSRLAGKVLATFVNGNLVFDDGKHAPDACGTTILA